MNIIIFTINMIIIFNFQAVGNILLDYIVILQLNIFTVAVEYFHGRG